MKKASKFVEKFHSLNLLDEGETYVGAFLGRSMPTVWWRFFLGPLAMLAMRQYQVVISSRRIFFGKLSPLAQLNNFEAFTFDEAAVAMCSKRLLSYRVQFLFKNGRSLRLDANFRGAGRFDGFLITPDVLRVLQSLQR